MTVTIDRAGRIVIPKAIRDREGLVAGTELNLRVDNGKIELEALYQPARLERRHGMLVFVPPPSAPTITLDMVNQWIEADRNSRGLIDEPGVVDAPPAVGKQHRGARKKLEGAAKARGRGAS
jgi:AbrB family looped-hinge helix DNA binding protein